MDERFYVATDGAGLELFDGREVHWRLPEAGSGTWRDGEPTEVVHGPVVIRTARSLLDALDEVICVATGDQDHTTPGDAPGDRVVTSARLKLRTAWDVRSAGMFALDCADHVLGDAGDVALPDGTRLSDAVAEARRFLAGAPGSDEHRLGVLARLSTTRRLRRLGAAVGDLARQVLEEDLANELDATQDPAWTTAAAVADAVLCAIEALRHLAMPRYVAGREDATRERDTHASEVGVATIWETAWGPIAVGAEHESVYMPAAHLAREAAFRAREAASQRNGAAGEDLEGQWQAARLEEILSA